MTSRSRVSKFILCVLLLVAALLWIRREQLDARYEAENAAFEADMAAAREKRTAELGLIWKAEALVDKAYAATDPAEQNRLYDELIAKGSESKDKDSQAVAASAMIEKAESTDDRAEKIALYDAVLFDRSGSNRSLFGSAIFRDRLELAANPKEKARLYDRYLVANGKDMRLQNIMSMLLDKAGVVDNAADKARLYDRAIAFYEPRLKSGKDSGARLQGFEREAMMHNFGRAILGRTGLLENSEEKIALYDRFLAFPFPRPERFFSGSRMLLEQILVKKAEASGDPAILENYYDERILKATTDRERVALYSGKARAVKGSRRSAVEEEIIDKFLESTDEEVESTVADLLLRKMTFTSDPDEMSAIADRLIARYGKSPNERVLNPVVRALLHKAGTAEDAATKLALYTALIDRYKDSDDYGVKRTVDEAVAARFRLEEKLKTEK